MVDRTSRRDTSSVVVFLIEQNVEIIVRCASGKKSLLRSFKKMIIASIRACSSTFRNCQLHRSCEVVEFFPS